TSTIHLTIGFLPVMQCCLTDFQIAGYISVRFTFRLELRGLLKLAHDLFWGVLFKLLHHRPSFHPATGFALKDSQIKRPDKPSPLQVRYAREPLSSSDSSSYTSLSTGSLGSMCRMRGLWWLANREPQVWKCFAVCLLCFESQNVFAMVNTLM